MSIRKNTLAVRILTALLVALVAAALTATPVAAETATWYGPNYDGGLTASGEVFDATGFTAAHPTLPLGTVLEVCFTSCTTVAVNDRGPVLDLSRAAADAIGLTDVGVADIGVTVL